VHKTSDVANVKSFVMVLMLRDGRWEKLELTSKECGIVKDVGLVGRNVKEIARVGKS